MPEVRNKSRVPHRYYDYARKAYVIWAPWDVKDVPHAVAQQVCQAHPGKMELVLPTPEEPEPVQAPVDVPDDFTEELAEAPEDFTLQAVDRAQRGGSRRSTKGS